MNQTHINFLLNSLFWSHTELFDLSFMSLIMMFQQLSTSFPNRIQTTHPHPNLTSSTNLYVSSINGKDHFHPLNPHNSFPLFFHRMFHFLLVMDREDWHAAVHGGRKESDTTEWLKWTETDDQKLRWVKKEAEKQPKRKQERENWQITKGANRKEKGRPNRKLIHCYT